MSLNVKFPRDLHSAGCIPLSGHLIRRMGKGSRRMKLDAHSKLTFDSFMFFLYSFEKNYVTNLNAKFLGSTMCWNESGKRKAHNTMHHRPGRRSGASSCNSLSLA